MPCANAALQTLGDAHPTLGCCARDLQSAHRATQRSNHPIVSLSASSVTTRPRKRIEHRYRSCNHMHDWPQRTENIYSRRPPGNLSLETHRISRTRCRLPKEQTV